MIFNILANNTDDHNKNFSFLILPFKRAIVPYMAMPAVTRAYTPMFCTSTFTLHKSWRTHVSDRRIHVSYKACATSFYQKHYYNEIVAFF